MTQTIRLFMLLEAVSFAAASIVHSGILVTGYEHAQARVAEGVIAAVLFAGLILSIIRQEWTRPVGIAAQGFALLGTLVGLFTIAIGVGPRTVPDLVYHAAILTVLVWGLIVTARTSSYQGSLHS
jgi:hypothetical protein